VSAVCEYGAGSGAPALAETAELMFIPPIAQVVAYLELFGFR